MDNTTNKQPFQIKYRPTRSNFDKKIIFFIIFCLCPKFDDDPKQKSPSRGLLFVGAGNGDRTRVLSLGSSRSTIELYPHAYMNNPNILLSQLFFNDLQPV